MVHGNEFEFEAEGSAADRTMVRATAAEPAAGI